MRKKGKEKQQYDERKKIKKIQFQKYMYKTEEKHKVDGWMARLKQANNHYRTIIWSYLITK